MGPQAALRLRQRALDRGEQCAGAFRRRRVSELRVGARLCVRSHSPESYAETRSKCTARSMTCLMLSCLFSWCKEQRNTCARARARPRARTRANAVGCGAHTNRRCLFCVYILSFERLYSQSAAHVLSVATFTASSMTCSICSRPEATFRIQTTSLWVILWTAATTL